MANPNFSVEKDMNLSSVNCETLEVGGDLTVGGAIRPGTFTNRVVTLNAAAAVPAAQQTPVLLTGAQSGTTFVLTGTGDQTIRLPLLPVLVGVTDAVAPQPENTNACSIGSRYSFLVGATPAAGSLFLISSGNTTSQDFTGSFMTCTAVTPFVAANAALFPASRSILTMDGTDRGGIVGTYVEFEAVAAQATGGTANACWRVQWARTRSIRPWHDTNPFS